MKKRNSIGLLIFFKITLSSLAASISQSIAIPPKITQLTPKTIEQRVIENQKNISNNTGNISGNTTKIDGEKTRALNAENVLDTRITSNSDNISKETSRASATETALRTDVDSKASQLSLDKEVSTRTSADFHLQDGIDAEKARALKAESGLDSKITSNFNNIAKETSRASAIETALRTDIDSKASQLSLDKEVSTRTSADSNLQDGINAEEARALNAEGGLDTRIKLNEGTIQQYQTRLDDNTQTMAKNTQQLSTNTTQLKASKDAMDMFKQNFISTRDTAIHNKHLITTTIQPQVKKNTQDILGIHSSLDLKADKSQLIGLAHESDLNPIRTTANQANTLAQKNQADLKGFIDLGLTHIDIKNAHNAIKNNTNDIKALTGIIGPNYANGQFAQDVKDLRTHSADIQRNTAAAAAAKTTADIALNQAKTANNTANNNLNHITALETKQGVIDTSVTQNTSSIGSLNVNFADEVDKGKVRDTQISSLEKKTSDLDTRLLNTENSVSTIETKLNDKDNGLTSKSSLIQTKDGMSQITGEKVTIDPNGDIHTGIDDLNISGTHSNRKLSEDIAKLGSFTQTTPSTGKSTTTFANNLATEGSLTVGKDLKINGNTSLKNTDIDGTLSVNGHTSFKNTVDITGETHANGGLTVGSGRNHINVGDRLNHLGKLSTANGSLDVTNSTGAMKILADTINRNAASTQSEVERITGIDISKFGSEISINPDESDTGKILTNKALTERSAANTASINHLDMRLGTAEGNIKVNSSSIKAEASTARAAELALGKHITSTDNNVTSLTSRVATNEGDISILKTQTGGMTTNNGTTSTSNNFDVGGGLSVAGKTLLNKGASVTGGLTTDTLTTTGDIVSGGDIKVNRNGTSTSVADVKQLEKLAGIKVSEFGSKVSNNANENDTTKILTNKALTQRSAKNIADIADNKLLISTNKKTIDHNSKLIAAEVSTARDAEALLRTNITTNETKITKNTNDIAGNKSLIDTNTAGINTNTGDITALKTSTGWITTNSDTTSTSNNFNIGKELNVTGHTSLNKGAAVTGGLTTDTLTTIGNTSIGGNLTLANKATSSNQAVRGDQLLELSKGITGQTAILDSNGNITTGINNNGTTAWTNTKLTGKVQDNKTRITTNRDSIVSEIITARAAEVALGNRIDSTNKDVTSLTDRVTINEGNITANKGDIAALKTKTGGMTTNNGTTSTSNNFNVGGGLSVAKGATITGGLATDTLTTSGDATVGGSLTLVNKATSSDQAVRGDQLEKLAGVGINKFSTISDVAGDQKSTVMTNRALTETVNKNIGTFDYTSNPRGGLGTMTSTGSSFGAVNRALADIDTLDTKQDTHLGKIDDTIKQFNADIKTNTQHIASLDTKVTGLTTDVKNLENIVGVSHSTTQSSGSISPTQVVSRQLSQTSGTLQLPQQVSGATNGGVVSSSSAQNGLIPPALVNNQGYNTNPQGVVHSVQTNYQDTLTNSKFIGDTSKLHNNLKDGANTNTVTAINKVDNKAVKNTSDISTNKSKISENRKTIDHNSAVLANRSARNAAAIQDQNKAIRANSAKIDQVQSESRKGLADAAAMGSIKYPKLDTGEGAVGAGYGNYKGQSSIAIGVGVQATDNVFVNTSAAATSGADSSVLVGAGVTYKFKLF